MIDWHVPPWARAGTCTSPERSAMRSGLVALPPTGPKCTPRSMVPTLTVCHPSRRMEPPPKEGTVIMAQATAGTRRTSTGRKPAAPPSPFSWGDRFSEFLDRAEIKARKFWAQFQLASTIALWSIVAFWFMMHS